MPSKLSWLDHDAAAAQRSLQILSYFEEREARDELGIGGIRDAVADQLFPGTSTIQTRLRYVFFVPWLFDQLEAKSTASSNFPDAARESENRLLAALIENTKAAEPGVIGREAGSSLKRLPSSVYWATLGSWGMRKADSSIQQYFALADRRYELRRQQRRRHDGDAHDGDATGRVWHAQLARLRPDDFPRCATLKLSRSEAEFLLDRWKLAHPESLLSWLAIDLAEGGAMPEAERIWEHPRKGAFPQPIQVLIEDARCFDALIHGAALLYNLQLAELDTRIDLAEEYKARLESWASSDLSACAAWKLDEFWTRVVGKGHSITDKTQRFVRSWLALALRDRERIAESAECRALVKARECDLKKERSRFTNRAALSQWGGKAGLVPLSYRWPIASNFLHEWHDGWKAA
ncbi:conserved hypothetical protein [Ricinus communis]|uniref:Uncharacterized protein n=1 Tax=Ricinus communis TaxID=3988 RepID=B9TAE9_RICCO|nr:conserved hypothetical protein [Ricinus communis]